MSDPGVANSAISVVDAFGQGRGRLSLQSTVLGIVPHFKCEPWLDDCLDSLIQQTRPLDGIVVIDDGSDDPPVDIVSRFPTVTLLASPENAGPYRLSQEVIASTRYDAYCFQDADDWSLPNRLELLLREAERTGAELVGCQGFRLIGVEGEAVPMTYPLDVNAALEANPRYHAIMHPSSVVSRDLVQRIGGYASGMKFAGDTEFEHRATYATRIVNVPQFAYVIRNRENSLTSSPSTGLRSPDRRALKDLEFERADGNAARVKAGEPPDLRPLVTAPPLPLRHLAGPKLRGAEGRAWP
jgi:glycosyltransferase involved in cell wall biosynthesis